MSEDDLSRRVPRILKVDAEGIHLTGSGDCVLDVRFGGRRVWSFWSRRDSSVQTAGKRLASWPTPLANRLAGMAEVSIVEHGSDVALFDEAVAFGTGEEPLDLVDKAGQPLGIDNNGKLVPTFETRSDSQTQPLLDSLEAVLNTLSDMGFAAFPAYGTLLGAVREQQLIGHDSDADIAYISEYTQPFDVIRESFDMQRRLHRAGYRTMRYSGASLKIHITEPDGFRRGLDIFGGYHDGDSLHLLGEVRTPFRREWIFPLSTTRLGNKVLPAPAEPDRLLEVMYGPAWRTPDPAFVFTTPSSTIKAFNATFRATRARRLAWSKSLTASAQAGKKGPSALARHLVDVEGVPDQVFDLGAGLGVDGLWLARQGSEVVAFDYIRSLPLQRKERRAAREGHSLTYRRLNLQELRWVFAEGARAARQPGPRTLLANHVFDAVGAFGRDSLARFASMSLRQGGRIYCDFWSGGGKRREGYPLTPVSIDEVGERLRRQGLDILSAEDLGRVDSDSDDERRTGRVIAQWA